MGTRSGDMDPAIMEYIAKKENLDIAGVMNVLNKKSGVLGVSNNLSSDFRDLEDGMNNGNKFAKAAMEVFCYRVAKYIGSYVAAMNVWMQLHLQRVLVRTPVLYVRWFWKILNILALLLMRKLIKNVARIL